jgi:hypothetical protein
LGLRLQGVNGFSSIAHLPQGELRPQAFLHTSILSVGRPYSQWSEYDDGSSVAEDPAVVSKLSTHWNLNPWLVL